MKDVIDVMQLQRDKCRQVPAIDYTETENGFIAMRYIFECGKDMSCYELDESGGHLSRVIDVRNAYKIYIAYGTGTYVIFLAVLDSFICLLVITSKHNQI